jgi:hypothetical protein
VPEKSVKLKHALVLTGKFTFKPASKSVELYRSVVSSALNMEDLISNSFVNSISNKDICNVFYYIYIFRTSYLWGNLYVVLNK